MDKTALAVPVFEPIFALERVSFAYTGQRQLFKNVSFALHPAEQVGLYGPNGSGKTTFFRLITGLARPDEGTVFFHGKAVRNEKGFMALRCKVGLVLQHAEDQLFCPTVLDDVAFGPLNLGLSPQEARERAVRTLESLGLAGFEDRLTHRLSGGEKKLVSLATVLAMDPEALLLDEPTNDLDPEARQRVIDLLQEQNRACVIISHDWDFLTRTTTRRISIVDGRLVEADPSYIHAHFK